MRNPLYLFSLSKTIRIIAVAFMLVFLVGVFAYMSRSHASNLSSIHKKTTAHMGGYTNLPATDARQSDCPRCAPVGDNEIYIPLIDLPEAAGGELVFNSRSPKEMEVIPTFYKLDGSPIIGNAVVIQSAEIRYVNIRKLIPAEHRDEGNWGGLALSYHGVPREMWGQFRLIRVNNGSNVDEFFTVKGEPRSDTQEAVWWTPDKSNSIIAIGNVTEVPTSATVTFENGETQFVQLPPRATEVIRRKNVEERESVVIKTTGQPGSVVPTGFITTKDGSFNSVIRFYDTKKTKQAHLFANGMRLAGVTPHMVIKNTSTQSIIAQPKFSTLKGIRGVESVVLPKIVLASRQSTEVDLSPLLLAIKSRPDFDVASVQVTNSGMAGSLIGAVYSMNSQTGVNYETPLRDSGPVRSMTGSYPWKISDDYSTIVYITNISDQKAEFVGEINYNGGNVIIDPRVLGPSESAVFDLQKIRDEQKEDNAGRSLPTNVSLGQFKWAVRGETNGKLLLIGRAEMVSRSHKISTSYSCNDPCPPRYDGWLNPFPPPIIFVNSTGDSAAWEIMTYDWGYTVGPYAVSAAWSLDNSIGTLDPIAGHNTMVTGTTPGSATFVGFIGIFQDYGWDGLNCYEYGTYETGGSGPVQVVPTVNQLDATLPSTKNPVTSSSPAPGSFTTTNNTLNFATTSTSDMVVVFQSGEEVTVKAQGVNPSSSLGNLRWKIDRDPSDTVATGLPTLNVQSTLVGVVTDTAGNFRLICYYDTNSDNAYNAGEELRVLRLAIVKATAQSGSFIRTSYVFSGNPGGTGVLVQNAMDLQFDVLLEGGGSSRQIGINKLVLGSVGNLLGDNFLVNYPVPVPTPPAPANVSGTGSENPGGATPMVDTVNVTMGNQPTGSSTPFRGNSNSTSLGNGPGGNGQIIRVTSLDAPGFGWLNLHSTTTNPWQTTVQGNAFKEYVVGYSTTFPRNYVAFATGAWTVNADGYRRRMSWNTSGASVVISGTSGSSVAMTSVITSGSPQTGDASGIQVLGLSFVRQYTMVYVP